MPCGKPQCDFSVFWPAGVLSVQKAFSVIYTPHLFVAAVKGLLLPGISYETFFYPPTALLIFWPLAHLPFEAAAFVWFLSSVVCAIALLRISRFEWPVILVGLLAPAALLNYQLNQFGVIMGAIFLAAIRLGERRGFLGGGLAGLFAIKPQLGLLLPFLWATQRNLPALVGFIFVLSGIVLFSFCLFGMPAWHAYLTLGRLQSLHILSAPFDPHGAQGWGVSIYWMVRSFGVSPAGANLFQLISALLVLAYLLSRAWPPDRLGTVMVCLSLLVTPYANTPDMVAFSLMLAESARQRGWRIGLLDALLFLWPGICLVVSIATGHELTPLIVLAALLRAALPASPPVLPAPAQE
ncbi:MAG: DUF2029 domain-containing protein [Rhodospirillales bacterium]|nr:DUF2029 domain-containing protein [Rhodospirillales bacterium]